MADFSNSIPVSDRITGAISHHSTVKIDASALLDIVDMLNAARAMLTGGILAATGSSAGFEDREVADGLDTILRSAWDKLTTARDTLEAVRQ